MGEVISFLIKGFFKIFISILDYGRLVLCSTVHNVQWQPRNESDTFDPFYKRVSPVIFFSEGRDSKAIKAHFQM